MENQTHESFKEVERLTSEGVNQAILSGNPIVVRVERGQKGSGRMEDGWEVWGVDEAAGNVFVKKFGVEGDKTLSKTVRVEDLKSWNDFSRISVEISKPAEMSIEPKVFALEEYQAMRRQPVWDKSNDISIGTVVGAGLKGKPTQASVGGFNQEFLRLIDLKGIRISQGLIPVLIDRKRMLMDTELGSFGRLFSDAVDLDEDTKTKYGAWLSGDGN